MLKKIKKTQSEGFTIIEIVIVLAIAALILLIVFLALPALQRSQRNTSRKSDAGHISSAINDWVSNNNGQLPGNTGGNGNSWATDCGTIIDDAGSLSQYNSGNSFGCTGNGLGTGTVNKLAEYYGSGTALTGRKGQTMVLVENAQCATNGSDYTASATPTPAAANTSRQAALYYTVEPAGTANWLYNCITSQ